MYQSAYVQHLVHSTCTHHVLTFLPHTLLQVFFIDYGNCEIVPQKNIIPEAVCPDLFPQATGLNFTSLSKAVLTEEQHSSLSQLLIDECITVEIRGTDDRGLLIASCDVIDSWIQQELTKN